AQQRGHTLWAATADQLRCRANGPTAQPRITATAITIKANATSSSPAEPWWSALQEASLGPEDIDIILMRKDPPFDVNYLVATQLLEVFERMGVRVVNRPQALRDHGEKLSALEFTRWGPPGLVSADIAHLRAFAQEHPKVVYKPLDAMGGSGIFVTEAADPNLPVILELLTNLGERAIMAQRHLPEIVEGDKRILLIDGEPVPHALARIPPAGASRGNLAAGGRARAQPLTEQDHAIAADLGPTLAARGLFLVGLDVIGAHLTEINVTSPTGFQEITQQTGFDVAEHFITRLEGLL
ncbi:MAG TPA: glutathione synthase, partial [Burkholderiaceae bacterium]|nr:glutathione synthase [Burkholderiaceae bacterium]